MANRLKKQGPFEIWTNYHDDTVPFKGAVLFSSRKHDSCATGEYCTTCEQHGRSEQHGRTKGSEVFTWNWECNQVRQILGQYFTGRNTVEIRRTRIAAALRDGKSITLVKLLRAKYCADSCDTRWTKPLPAACPSQRWWAFSLSLPSSASRLATSSSTHWTSTKQVEDECGGKNDKATGSGRANDWRKMFGEVVWKCSQKKENEKGMEEKHTGGLMCYRTDELTGEHSNTRHG